MPERSIDIFTGDAIPAETLLSTVSHHRRIATTVAAIATTAALLEGCSHSSPPPPDTCTDASHELASSGDSPDWIKLAEQFSQDRSYHISKTRLSRANPAIKATKTQDGKICFALPSPVFAGYEEATGKETMQKIAKDNLEPMKTLIRKNPRLKSDPAYIPPGRYNSEHQHR